MKVFVTGATGYIGRAVATTVQARGHHVLGLARSDQAAALLQGRGIEPLSGDLRAGAGLVAGADRADAVIHCAAMRGPEMAETERGAVTALLGALVGSDKPFVYTGAAFVYGDTGDHVADEDTPLDGPTILPWRRAIEGEVRAAADRGVRSVVLRVPLVYGRGGSFILPTLIGLARAAGAASYVGTGENHWSTVHVEDLADLYVRALERAAGGTVFNAAADPPVQWRRLAQAIGHAAGVDGRIRSWPVAEAARVFGPYAQGFTENQRLCAARARAVLGWAPRACSVLADLEHGSYAARPASSGVARP